MHVSSNDGLLSKCPEPCVSVTALYRKLGSANLERKHLSNIGDVRCALLIRIARLVGYDYCIWTVLQYALGRLWGWRCALERTETPGILRQLGSWRSVPRHAGAILPPRIAMQPVTAL